MAPKRKPVFESVEENSMFGGGIAAKLSRPAKTAEPGGAVTDIHALREPDAPAGTDEPGAPDPLGDIDALLGHRDEAATAAKAAPAPRPRRRRASAEPDGKAVISVPVSVINDARDRLRPAHTGHNRTLAAPLLLAAYVRAVHELGLRIDVTGLERGDEDEALARVRDALAQHFA